MVDSVSVDPFTNLYLDHAAIRRDVAVANTEILKEGLKTEANIIRDANLSAYNARGDIKDARFDLASRMADGNAVLGRQVDAIDDSITAQLVTIARESADNRAQLQGLGYQIRDGHIALGKDVELNSLKGMLDAQKNTTYLSDKIGNEGDKTRELINSLQNNDLNRALVERSAALVALESDNRHWGHRYDTARWDGQHAAFGAQFAQLQTMMQNVNSQIADTKQSMVNFGNMMGVGQSATSNTVR